MGILFMAVSIVQANEPVVCTCSKDTINLIDRNGKRQGHWKITGRMVNHAAFKRSQAKGLAAPTTDYPNNVLVEEGCYQDQRKNGVWKRYYPNGHLQREVTYRNNRPFGKYSTYYENGQLKEQGTWKGHGNVGSLKQWHENGQLAKDFHFNAYGKREGPQKYYNKKGRLMMEVHAENGTTIHSQRW